MEKNKKNQDNKNRFTYDSDQGLSVVKPEKQDKTTTKKEDQSEIKKGYEKWL